MLKITATFIIRALSVTLVTCMPAVAENTDEGFKFVGKAYTIESNTLLYSELHHYESPFLHKVQYKEADGTVFATKSVDYTQSFYSPEFVLKNNRTGEFIRTQKQNNIITLEYKENTDSSTDTEIIDDTPTLIIDAGFDHYITQNWKSLLGGKSLTIDYLIPSLGDYYELTLKKTECKVKDSHCFSISASSFFIRIFSQELKLTYAKFEQSNQPNIYRLASFQGRTNISDAEGNYQDAIIRYSY